MKLHLECVPCYIRQTLDAAKMATDNKILLKHILKESLKAAYEFDTESNGLLTQAKIQKAVKHLIPNGDPYSDIKKKFNLICLGLEERLKKIIKESKDSFETGLRICLAGNIIDFGPKQTLGKKVILCTIKNALHQNLDSNKIKLLKENINKSEKILFIGDNAGEIVFDKIFIEKLPKRKITYVVRGGPTLNDSTMEDAEMIGMTKIVKVITTGLDMPAAILPLCSKEFLDKYNNSDLVISKGQGNYEALSNENKNIFFCLK
ncbi:MAG: ARMT1-like domain-containing protein [Actinomycetota bacterium]|nr:ARMT1-like domain-containing protein [Actinomycetota bacterium]